MPYLDMPIPVDPKPVINPITQPVGDPLVGPDVNPAHERVDAFARSVDVPRW